MYMKKSIEEVEFDETWYQFKTDVYNLGEYRDCFDEND